MPASTKLLTTGLMDVADLDSVTSEATGYPKENMIDNNPDTFWRATTDAYQAIDIDLNAAYAVSGAFAFIRNYKSSWTNAAMVLQRSSDDTTYGGDTAIFLNAASDPIKIIKLSGTYRYWRLAFNNITGETIPDVGMIGLFVEREIEFGNEWPEKDSDKFYNKTVKAADGRRYVRRLNKNSTRIIPRTWLINSDVDWESTPLYLAHQDSGGSALPLILQEDSVNRLVRFTDDELDRNARQYRLFEPTVTFEEMPHIDDGDSF